MPLKTFLRVGAYYQSISGKALSTDLEITEIVNNDNPLEPFINDESAGGGAGGSATLQEDITYAALVVKINAGTLSKGQQYKITDYTTKHYIVDTTGVQYLSTIITGVNEALIVTAISTSIIDKVAYSILHPKDIIHYDWNPVNWLDDLSFSNFSGTPAIITGFKGVIYFRHDTVLDNYMGYDFRNCKFRRWETNAPAWSSVTTYAAENVVNHANGIYQALKASNINNTPVLGSDWWVKILDISITPYWFTGPGFGSIPQGAGFIDTKTFTESGSATYEKCCVSNHIEPFKDTYTRYGVSATILSNNVFYLNDHATQYHVFSNRIGPSSYGNTIYGQFQENSIGIYMYHNIIWAPVDGTSQCFSTGNDFGENILVSPNGISFGNLCAANKISNALSASFGNRGSYNIFASLTEVSIGNKVSFISAGNNFKRNTICDGITGIDFTAATHVYGNYTCRILINNAEQAKLEYFNGITPTIVNANA